MPSSPYLQETGTLYHQGEAIIYTVRYGRPDRVRMTLRVMPDGRVEVLLPLGMPFSKGHAMIRQREDWLVRQWQRFRQSRLVAPPPERRDQRYVLGDLCRVERLTAHHWYGVTWKPPTPSGAEGRLLCSASSEAHAESLLQRWYAQKTLDVCTSRLTVLQHTVPWLTAQPPLRVRRFRRRWGSCSNQGVITLTSQLCRLPTPCIDYVLLHELTHLAVFNHSPAFYAALSRLLPDWQSCRRQLEAFPSPWQPAATNELADPADS